VTGLTDIPNSVLQQVWQWSMSGVAPSQVPETFGCVVTEARRSGRAVVSSSIGDPLHTVRHGETGLILPPGNVAALASALESLIDDPTLRQRTGSQARRRGEHLFSADIVVAPFEAFLRSHRVGAEKAIVTG
jgi:glycosyltransferase involved in cell wall biosynthesis